MRIAAQELRTNGVELNKSKLRDSLRLIIVDAIYTYIISVSLIVLLLLIGL